MGTFLLLLFIFLLFMIFIYSLTELDLLLKYWKSRRSETSQVLKTCEVYPVVTIQLPIYNEENVVERLLKNIAELDYPREKLEIQVLDDSTDDSVALISALVKEIWEQGLDIKHLRRSNRDGFKAGALKEGLKTAKGELIAVFDADFLPLNDWLLKTLPYFSDKHLGVVQTRWGHLNRDYSSLTKVQAFALDFHFILEQNGRNFGKHFINFNGTAGIWRKECILDAGNWEGDTLTEDLDLSYRAQLKGWKFKYLEEVETPAELPIDIEAARSQQFRWNKGAAENFRKSIGKVLESSELSFRTKLHSFFHLLNSSMFLLVLCLGILSLPVLYLIDDPQNHVYVQLMSLFGVSSLIFFLCYWVSYSRIHGKSFKTSLNYLGMFFGFFSVAMGFSLHNSIAVLEGHSGKRSDFVRTPKFNVAPNEKRHIKKKGRISFQFLLEILLLLYFGAAIYAAFYLQNYSFLLFHLMLFFGFGFVVFESAKGLSPKALLDAFGLSNFGYKKFQWLLLLSVCALYLSFAYDLDRADFSKLFGLYLALFFLSWKLFQLERGNFNFLISAAFLFRLLFLFAIPNLSQDFYRFLWDGKLLLNGISPYLFTPVSLVSTGNIPFENSGALLEGMGALSAGNHSNYPPLNQLMFALAALFTGKGILGGVIALRLLVILADVGVLYFGRKLLKHLNLPENRIFWYLLNPFVILELTGNLHFEGVMIFFLLCGLYLLFKGKLLWSAVILALSVSVKLMPLLFLPLLFRYLGKNGEPGEKNSGSLKKPLLYYLVVVGMTLLSFLPFLSWEFFYNYFETLGLWFQKFEFNASIYYLIRWLGFQIAGFNIIGVAGVVLSSLVLLFVLGLSFFPRNKTGKGLLNSMLLAIIVYYFLATTVHPWYLALPLILSIFTGYRFVLVWTAAVVLSYFAYSNPSYEENLWIVAVEYLVVIVFLVYESRRTSPKF